MNQSGGSLNLRQYLRLRVLGVEMADAAEQVGMGLGEAALTDKAHEAGELAHIDLTQPATIGHNSKEQEIMDVAELEKVERRLDASIAQADRAASVAANELKLFVERVERLSEEKKGIGDDIKDVMNEMRGRGYDTKIVRKILAIRKKKKGEHAEEQALLETYMSALGMQYALI